MENVEEKKKNYKKNRQVFSKRLNENLKQRCSQVLKLNDYTYIAQVNWDFAYELAEIFNDTIVEMLLEGVAVPFDQFGRYEIQIQQNKKVHSIFTGNQDLILPEVKIIRFYPAKNLKRLIGGKIDKKVKRLNPFEKIALRNNIIEGKDDENGDS